MAKRKVKKKSLKQELIRLDRIFQHLHENISIKKQKDNNKEEFTLKDQFKNIFSFIHSYSTDKNRDLFVQKVNEDFLYLSSLKFAIYDDVKTLLLPQSITGHALYGHSRFIDSMGRPIVFADTSIEKVISALDPDLLSFPQNKIAELRQRFIEEIINFVDGNFNKNTAFLVNEDGRGLFGIKFLEKIEVSIPDFLKGFYLGAMMDNYNFRMITNKKHKVNLYGIPFNMGGGEIYIFDNDKFKLTGLRPRDLSDKEIPIEDIKKMKEYGIIIEDEQIDKIKNVSSYYIRRAEGSGVCDDAALIFIGKKYGISAFWGGFIADACDTYDKFLVNYISLGYDEYIAKHIYRLWHDKYHESIVNLNDVIDIIFLAAEENYPKIGFSSSHRRLIQFEENAKSPTILEHLNFILGKPVDNILLGFERFPSEEFYKIIETRAKIIKLDL